jgi:hypothetical protein
MNHLTLEYDRDNHQWTLHHIELLKQRQFSQMDVEHLIEELESMANRDRHELMSRFIILIAHLLKWQFQPAKRSSSWRGSIIEQRVQIAVQLEESPSLKHYLTTAIDKAYPHAIKIAVKETLLPKSTFPETCPYLVEQLLDDDFFPDRRH